MAFKTRSGRTVAVGTGAMTAAWVLTLISLPLLLLPVAVAMSCFAWLVAPAAREAMETALAHGLALSITALGFYILLRALAAPFVFMGFIGPKDRFRDQVKAIAQSRAGWCASAGATLAFALMIAMRFPFGESRPFVVMTLTAALIFTESTLVHSLRRIRFSSRQAAYFEGMTEPEKVIADKTWPTAKRPSFPPIDAVGSAEDAARYARRAHDIAELHTWIGAGIIVVFTAFVGVSISSLWIAPRTESSFPAIIVLGFIALGYWIQRRSRVYRTLGEEFTERAQHLKRDKIEAERMKEPEPWSTRARRFLFPIRHKNALSVRAPRGQRSADRA